MQTSPCYHFGQSFSHSWVVNEMLYIKCEKHFIKMLQDVGTTMPRSAGTIKMQYMQAKLVMMAWEIRSSMKAKASYGWYARIITCRCQEGLRMLWWLHAPLSSCCSLFLMSSSLALPAYTALCSCTFSIVSFNILMNTFSLFYCQIHAVVFHARAPRLLLLAVTWNHTRIITENGVGVYGNAWSTRAGKVLRLET